MGDLATRRPVRVDRGGEEPDPGGGERAAHVLGVLGEGLPAGGGAAEGRRAELELASGLVGDRAPTGGRTDHVEQVTEQSDRHGVGGVVLEGDQPLQLGADQSGWSGLEAHAFDEPANGGAVHQSLGGVASQDGHALEPNHTHRQCAPVGARQ
jgi:hypothetical protein